MQSPDARRGAGAQTSTTLAFRYVDDNGPAAQRVKNIKSLARQRARHRGAPGYHNRRLTAITATRPILQILAAATQRKRLLLKGAAYFRVWPHAFPKHCPVTRQLLSPPDPLASEPWRQAAREYHKERGTRTLVVEMPKKAKRLRRLIADPSISLERMLDEFSRDRPTPRCTIEALSLDVREHGIAALSEPAAAARWQRCDEAARAEILAHLARMSERQR